MIVEVLVAQRQPVNALRQHLRQLVPDQQRRAAIAEAVREPVQQVDLAIRLAQQQRSAVAADPAALNSAATRPEKCGANEKQL